MENDAAYFAHSTAIIDQPVSIGKDTKVWHWVHVMKGAVIGEECVLGQNVYVGGNAELGNNVSVQNNVSIYDRVILEDDVFCGPSMVFTNVINPRSTIERKDEYMTTRVKKGASIGANTTIVCGNTIGKYALVGAGCVITKDVPDYALMVGAPAKQIGWVSQSGVRLDFDHNNVAICPDMGEKYKLENSKIKLLQ